MKRPSKAAIARQRKPCKLLGTAHWLRRVQTLIWKHATPVRTRGPNKGHASVNELLWLKDLASELRRYIRQRNPSGAYDNNLAIASLMGRVLATWYCACHRAKSLDPRRPLNRRKANRTVTKYRGNLVAALADDELMCRVFKDQPWNFPWGKAAIGGTFV